MRREIREVQYRYRIFNKFMRLTITIRQRCGAPPSPPPQRPSLLLLLLLMYKAAHSPHASTACARTNLR
jgi:hypothetical protein